MHQPQINNWFWGRVIPIREPFADFPCIWPTWRQPSRITEADCTTHTPIQGYKISYNQKEREGVLSEVWRARGKCELIARELRHVVHYNAGCISRHLDTRWIHYHGTGHICDIITPPPLPSSANSFQHSSSP